MAHGSKQAAQQVTGCEAPTAELVACLSPDSSFNIRFSLVLTGV